MYNIFRKRSGVLMNNKQIGFFIKSLREEKEITQEKLSSIINVDRSVIAKIEAGKRMPTTEQLLILKKYICAILEKVETVILCLTETLILKRQWIFLKRQVNISGALQPMKEL